MVLMRLAQLWLPGDRMADRLQECCPRRGKRFAASQAPCVFILFNTFVAEYGHADVSITRVNSHVDRLFTGLGDGIPVFMSHYDKLTNLPTVREMNLHFWTTY
jgi:hypothetical protein